jgi:hypothetical protein
MNDKCAADTGRFLEVMAKVLDIGIDQMGPIFLLGEDPCQISSTCTDLLRRRWSLFDQRAKAGKTYLPGYIKPWLIG